MTDHTGLPVAGYQPQSQERDLERRCTACGSPEIAAVAPGDETVRSDLLDLALDAGRPLIAWCMPCWVRRFGR